MYVCVRLEATEQHRVTVASDGASMLQEATLIHGVALRYVLHHTLTRWSHVIQGLDLEA